MSYSALINWLKVVLPLLALALLATLFLLGRERPQQATLPFIEDLRERVAGREGMLSSVFSGSTEDGDAVKVTANTMRPDPTDPDRTLASDLAATISYLDGTQVNLNATEARYSELNERLVLTGEVVLSSSDGYRIRSNQIITDIALGEATSPGPVEADGPIGQLKAGRMLLTRPQNGKSDVHLVFTNGVNLIYQRGTEAQ